MDYSGDTLDLQDKSIYRDLAIPPSEKAFDLIRPIVLSYLQQIQPFTRISFDDVLRRFSLDDFLGHSQDAQETIREYFAMPEAVMSPSFALPMWAESPFDFIYKHRKLLESQTVSQTLHFWINQSPFAEDHPKRATARRAPFCTHLSQFSSSLIDIVHIEIHENTSGKLVISVLTRAGISWRIRLGWRNGLTDEVLRQFSSPDFRHPLIDVTHKSSPQLPDVEFLISYQRSFLFTSLNSVELQLAGQKIKTGLNQVTCLAADGKWIVAGGDAWLAVFRDLEKVHDIQAYRDSVSTCCVSQEFNVIVTGTNDGSLILWACDSAALIRAIELGRFRPVKILVSKYWGFIVSYCSEIVRGSLKPHIFVHSINGVLLRRAEIGAAVDFWCSWSSYDGFDYLFYSTDRGSKWNICEIYRVTVPRLVYGSLSKVLACYYSNDLEVLVVATIGSNVFFIPFQIGNGADA
jgi:WD40 repeat protein